MRMEKTTRLRGCLLVKKWLYNYVVCNCDLRQLLDPRLCFCFFATNRCLSFGVFWRVRVCSDVLACSGVFWCSGIPVFLSYCVPVFLILVHAEGCKPHHRCLQSKLKFLVQHHFFQLWLAIFISKCILPHSKANQTGYVLAKHKFLQPLIPLYIWHDAFYPNYKPNQD